MNNRDTLIWLNSINVIGSKTIGKLERSFGELRLIWDAPGESIDKLTFLNEKNKNSIIKNRNKEYYNKHIHKIKELGIEIITIYDKKYPSGLKNIYEAPMVLYVKGEVLEEDIFSIGIVGSRKATAYGKWAAEKFSKELAQQGITVVSGMARGIDTRAHWGAIDSKGRTLAILGSGINVIYPRNNRELYYKICENGGVISEFPPDTPPLPQNFPQRNRIISGLSLGVVVIEAGEKSGSLITAHHAIDQGKEVFALPGNINSIYSRGTNLLIKDGAKLLVDIDDIFEEIIQLKDKRVSKRKERINYEDLSIDESAIIKCIIEKPIHCDIISHCCGLDISKVNSILTILEMKGLVKQLPGKIFTIC